MMMTVAEFGAHQTMGPVTRGERGNMGGCDPEGVGAPVEEAGEAGVSGEFGTVGAG